MLGKTATVTTSAPGKVFPGQYYDVETGCHYNYHRYYCPDIGRYLTSDPIGLLGGLNTYLYANAAPTKFIDPYGLDFGFSVDPLAAGGNGHTTFYYQDGGGAWYSFDQFANGETFLGGNIGFLTGSNAQGGIEISPITAPPGSATLFPSTSEEDASIASCASKSLDGHRMGNIQYDLYSNNCTDAPVDVLRCAGIRVYNPALTIKPNSWMRELPGNAPRRCRSTRRGLRCN